MFERLLQASDSAFQFSFVGATSPGEKTQQAVEWLSLHLARSRAVLQRVLAFERQSYRSRDLAVSGI